MNGDDYNLLSGDNLDEAIRNAIQVNTDPQRLARLERYWHVQSQRQLRLRRAWRAIPLAAASMATIAALVVFWVDQERIKFAHEIRDSGQTRDDTGPAESLLAKHADLTEHSQLAGRAPTAYEHFMFAVRTSAQVPTASQAATIDVTIDRLARDPASKAEQVLDEQGVKRSNAERLLLRQLPRSANAEQVAILRLLAICGTPRSVPALLRLARNDTVQEDVLATIEQIVGIERVACIAGDTADIKVRIALIRRLLATGSEPALLGYLSLVRDDATRFDALVVAGDAADLPIAALLNLLDHKDPGVRLSAAIVLGHVNGPEVTQLLIARVTERPSDSTEAWMALLACHGEMAEEFLAYAMQRPQLLGHFNGARVRWAQMIP